MEKKVKCIMAGCRRKTQLIEKGKTMDVYKCGCGAVFTVKKQKKTISK